MLLAHPLTETRGLPVSPVVAGVLAACVVAVAARYWPRPARGTEPQETGFPSWQGPLGTGQVIGRVVGGTALLLAVAAGRLGSPNELENLAPALVIGVAWPGLLFLSGAGGPVWPWLDPWDGTARVFERRTPDDPGAVDVRPALAVALVWTWYLGVFPDPLDPRAVGLALATYSLLTVGGCLIVGRARWMSRVELFGILFGSLALLPRGRLSRWTPPKGMDLLLGALAGGLLFGAVRRTELWGGLNAVEGATAYATGALLASAALGAALTRWLASGAAAVVAIAALPAVAGIAVAIGMARSRLFTSLQLLPRLASDPFGQGWDLFGTAWLRVDAPLTPGTLWAVQLSVLLAGCIAGAVAAAPRSGEGWPRGAIAAVILAALGTTAVTLVPGL